MRPATALLGGCALVAGFSLSGGPVIHLPARDEMASIAKLEDERNLGAELFAFLVSANPATRARAAVAAGRIGDPRAIDPLAALLLDSEASVRAGAAFALGEIEDSSAAAPLASLLRSRAEADPRVRALAMEGLGKLRASRYAPLCAAALSDSSAGVRGAAALASWQMQAASVWREVARAARDPDPEVQWKATYALMRMLGAAAPGRTQIPGAAALPDTARAAIQAVLIEKIHDPDFRIRLASVRGVGAFPGPDAGGILAAALADSDWRVRVEAIRALGATPAGQAAPAADRAAPAVPPIDPAALRSILGDANPNVRVAALEALSNARFVDGREAVSLLQSVLSRAYLTDREREVASISLGVRWKSELETAAPARAAGLRSSIAGLAKTLAGQGAWTLRAAAAEIADPSTPEGSAVLERLLHDDSRVAKTAIEPVFKARAAARAKGQDVLPALRPDLDRLLESPDPVLRAIVIETAGSILGDSIDSGPRGDWLALLRRQWIASKSDRQNDVPLAIAGQLERCAGLLDAQEILRMAASSDDPLVRREGIRILVEKGLETDAGAKGPIGTGRSTDDYASILTWARQDHLVVIRTLRGAIRIRLFSEDAPLTCWNFIHLADSGFYDRGRWHRVVPDFVAQDGCPRGDGYGGPGYTIRCEINERRFGTGAVGMALSGKDTGGSQFFICHSPQPHLDGRYTVFGQVVDGMATVDQLIQNDAIESIRSVAP